MVEKLDDEDVRLLSHIVHRYHDKVSPIDFLGVLCVIKGFCSNDKKHTFIFEESFEKEVSDTIGEYEQALAKNAERRDTIVKLAKLIHDTANQIKSLESSLKDLEKKKEFTNAEIGTGEMLVENVKLKFAKLTGSEDMNMWS